MKRTHSVVWTATILYAAISAVGWSVGTSQAREKTIKALHEARATFANVTEDAIDSVLWYSSRLVREEIGDTAKALSGEEMRRLAERHHLDEINIVASNGVVIASNLPENLGYDFHRHPLSDAFLKVLDPTQPIVCYGQPYRQSLNGTNQFCKYYGATFADRSGLVQIGFSLKRIVHTFERTPAHDYDDWTIGLYGRYQAVDSDGDGYVDLVSSLPDGFPEEGVMDEWRDERLGRVYRYEFAYCGLLFRALIPEREFHEQRNRLAIFVGVPLAGLMALLAFFFVRLTASSEKLAVLHQAAAERTAADLAVARVIQMSSLPHAEFFRLAHLDSTFDAAMYPAKEVGGDFYSLFEMSDHRVVFLVADVSGKGVPAAMFMHIAVNAIRTGFLAVNVVEEAVAAVNNYLCEHNEAEMFVTVWFGVLDPTNGVVEYVNAGHNRPYVVRRNGAVERLDGRGGLFLGMFPQRGYRTDRLKLEPGDRLFLYTDGVTEAMDANGQPYGTKRLERLLAAAPKGLCKAVKRDVDEYVAGAERSDDLTLLELTWYGHPTRVERTFAATEAALGDAVDFLRGEIRLTDAKKVTRLLNAADEMLSNVVNYSGVSAFTLTVENIPERCRVTITDEGVGYNPHTHVDPDTHAPLQRRDIGGLGILMAKKLVNSIDYHREGNRNVLTLVQLNFNAGYRKHGSDEIML